MPEVTITGNIEVYCGGCGKGLCRQSTEIRGGISVDPCEKCMERAKDEGFEEGFEKGRAEEGE